MFADAFWGVEGFEELRKYLKHNTELSKDIGILLAERAELELSYAKSLSKIGAKLSKATHVCIGTMAESWCLGGSEMEIEAELHRVFGQALLDDICKLIKTVVDSQSKARKPVEVAVEKALKNFLDRRLDEAKCKKNAHSLTKDREKTIEQVNSARDGKIKNVSEKDLAKLEKRVTQLEESVTKADKEYFEAGRKAEAARQDWESQVFKACVQLQSIEDERIRQMQDNLNRYAAYLAAIGPKMMTSCEKLHHAVGSIDAVSDIRRISETKGKRPNQSEQLLLEFYAEDRGNVMDFERRKYALQGYIYSLEQDLEKERKGRDGVMKLMGVYKGQPSFGDQDDGIQKLASVDSMIRYLEASHLKITSSLAELNRQPKPESQLMRHFERIKDRQGSSCMVLRMASLVSEGAVETNAAPAAYRPPADGSHFDDGEFDDPPISPISRCTAIYDFSAKADNELTIRAGDVLTVFRKDDDGWWFGELNGRSGIFPGSYVK